MNNGGKQVPEYSRQDLRRASRFVEGDYKGINPREFYRRLKRRLEEIQVRDGFKYVTSGTQRDDLRIISEAVGDKTGRLEGRLLAQSDWESLGTGLLEYKPYGPHGALAIVAGVLFTGAAGFAGHLDAAVLGVLLTIAGIYLYFQSEFGEFPVAQRDLLRVLITGEVSERQINDQGETRTDIFANMTVIYAGDTFVNVYTEPINPNLEHVVTGFDDMPWTLRRELVKEVQMWYNSIVGEGQRIDVSDGFFDQLGALSNRSVEDDRREINTIQGYVNQSFNVRLAYNDLVLNQLSEETQMMVHSQLDEIDDELQGLAEDMDVYVKREGLTHTS